MTCAVPLWLQPDPKDGHTGVNGPTVAPTHRHRFTPEGRLRYSPENTRRQALDLYAEGTGITAAGRVLGVKPATVFSWVK